MMGGRGMSGKNPGQGFGTNSIPDVMAASGSQEVLAHACPLPLAPGKEGQIHRTQHFADQKKSHGAIYFKWIAQVFCRFAWSVLHSESSDGSVRTPSGFWELWLLAVAPVAALAVCSQAPWPLCLQAQRAEGARRQNTSRHRSGRTSTGV